MFICSCALAFIISLFIKQDLRRQNAEKGKKLKNVNESSYEFTQNESNIRNQM
jgi:hypothetical protein